MNKFCVLASGSSGNATYLETEYTRILIDAGLSGKKIQTLLSSVEADPQKLDAILITHEHGDHIKGAGILSRRLDIPIIATDKTWEAMDRQVGRLKGRHRKVIHHAEAFYLRDIYVEAFSIRHDCADAVGYTFTTPHKKIAVMTDVGQITPEIVTKLQNSDIMLLEANYDPHMLSVGPYPPALQERIRGGNGHLSNGECARLLERLLRGHGEKIFLGHLSQENNTPRLAWETISKHLTGLGMDLKGDISLDVARRHDPSTYIIWE